MNRGKAHEPNISFLEHVAPLVEPLVDVSAPGGLQTEPSPQEGGHTELPPAVGDRLLVLWEGFNAGRDHSVHGPLVL